MKINISSVAICFGAAYVTFCGAAAHTQSLQSQLNKENRAAVAQDKTAPTPSPKVVHPKSVTKVKKVAADHMRTPLRQHVVRGALVRPVPTTLLETVVQPTTDQKTQIAGIQKKFADETKALHSKPGEPIDKEKVTKLRAANKAANDQIAAVLTDEQRIQWANARKDAEVAAQAGVPLALFEKVKLSDDQKAELVKIKKEAAAKLKGLSKEERQAAAKDSAKEVKEKAKELLTSDQKAEIEKYNKENPRIVGRKKDRL